MRSLTRLEAHFLSSLLSSLRESGDLREQINGLFLLYPTDGPELELGIQTRSGQLYKLRVLIYGVRPVRYCFETTATGHASWLKQLFDRCFRNFDLVSERSGVRKGRLQLTYQVNYSDAFLKKLGE